MGPGNPKYLTVEVKEAIKKFDKVVAFGRVSSSLKHIREDIKTINKVTHIDYFLKEYDDILILASGDPCFYGIVEYLKGRNIKIEKIMPGISSFQYMMARLYKSWHEANFISLHGRDGNLETVKDHKLSIVLTDEENTPSKISNRLYEVGIKGRIYTGFNLSYEDEKIIKKEVGEKIDDISPLAVVVIENEMD
ncbi:precorrin-6y C5,15-methyltransferase (decarboxylating) subunit CbiE [Tepidimicrobium xylanilyticum]|uniref:precorrin-6y C5,15-methyltransferase (decarboxylating) subunit CbiE n=1 Tax=Tepidimicrobium xylanilyticum TaxID=1123352 RepID=UPI000B809F04|nr:precorrin-6y C5,15-methyltransferase (decarboxylating) subunit CbiE [Tepidimicrobium xylanilyticum]